ncbi:hypothetical protein LG634_32830 [Streptomyces bambusae]|uniref:HEAT repeat domain-containing protein n=1 Tax=Streptomyces bambusae TaxID=1550616 RepID=UPI001CFF6D9E|nr:hypothetical protein [Streptomyces bambusae]MCB5169579.1 hypothetical protein [Streptomyces bambusae]
MTAWADNTTETAFGTVATTAAARNEAVRRLTADTALHAEWIVGLAVNPAAPDDVQLRVFSADPLPRARHWLAYCRLTPVAARTAAAHPDPDVRRTVAENPQLPAAELAALAEDPDPNVRRAAVFCAGDYAVALPARTVVRLAADPEPRIRYFATCLPGLPDAPLHTLAQDPDPRVRAAAAHSWDRLRPDIRSVLTADPDPQVRRAVERATHTEPPLPTTVDGFLAETAEGRRRDTAHRAPVDAALAAHLAAHEDAALRRAAAANPHLPTGLALSLAGDPDPAVRLAVSLRADLTEAQRAAVDHPVPKGRRPVPACVEERFGDPAALRAFAASGHVLLRRGVTCAPELPADVVARLAADEDYFVRLMLCENDHAPHELLLEMFADWDGLSWGSLAHCSSFARPGLARFADDANPRLRYAALFDPDAGPDLVERLTHDPDAMVGGHAAGDPRLPLPRLVALLGADGRPREAARNPALPVALMHRLLDIAEAGGSGGRS